MTRVPLRRNRDFVLLQVGQGLSTLGSTSTYVAYPLLVLALTHSAAKAGAVGFAKYGFGLNETDHKLVLMAITLFAAGAATIFRFWAYRTFVFLKPPVDGHEDTIAELDAAAGLAELSAEIDLETELASELNRSPHV